MCAPKASAQNPVPSSRAGAQAALWAQACRTKASGVIPGIPGGSASSAEETGSVHQPRPQPAQRRTSRARWQEPAQPLGSWVGLVSASASSVTSSAPSREPRSEHLIFPLRTEEGGRRQDPLRGQRPAAGRSQDLLPIFMEDNWFLT